VMKTLLSIRPFGISYKEEADRWSRWAPKWPNARIRSALRAARDTDEGLKNTTVSDERGLLLDLVLRMTVRRDGEGGGDGDGSQKKSARRTGMAGHLSSALSVLSAFSVLSALSAFSAPAQAQTDSRLIEAIRQAQEGRGDSARTRVRLLLASTSPTDTLYPQIIYTQAMVASDANEMRRQLQRVAVEYSSSSWADDALLRLVQLDYASGNLEGAARNLERIRLDYPGSTLLPQASYWAARTYFDQKAPEQACRWIAEGLSQLRGNVELENQLNYLDQRCAGVRANVALQSPSPAQPAPSGDTGTSALPSGRPDTVTSPLTNSAPPSPTPATPGVLGRVQFLDGDAGVLAALAGPADVILSNILRTANTALLPAISKALAPEGVAIFSGMEREESAEFLQALETAGFRPIQETVDAGWWAVAASRRQ
jgi:hypothetical protein